MDPIIDEFLAGVAALSVPAPAPDVSSPKIAARRALPKSRAPLPKPPQTSRPAPRSPAPLRGDFQLVTPSIDWDWPIAAAGSIPTLQFYYADSVPLSVAPGAPYAASAKSFSESYRVFLEMIDASTFPLTAELNSALQITAPPAGAPAETPNPPGWTKVLRSGVLRWAPNWVASDTSTDWMRKVQAGTIHNPGTISLDIRNRALPAHVVSAKTGQMTDAADQFAQFSSVQISAQDWGRISFYPGEWFNAALLSLAQAYVPNPSAFFGKGGLLSGRVSALLVGCGIDITFTGAPPLSPKVRKTLQTHSKLEVMGIPVALRASPSALAGQSPTVTYNSTTPSPMIVAVEVERYDPQP